MKIRILILSISVLCLLATPARAVLFGDGGAALQSVLDAPQDKDGDGTPENPYGILRYHSDPSISPLYPSNSVTAATDEIPDSLDSYWTLTAVGGSAETLIIELAAWAGSNTFGIYAGGVYIPVFTGSNSPGTQKTVSILADGTVKVNGSAVGSFAAGTEWFGYYLDSTGNTLGGGTPTDPTDDAFGGLWHSDSSLNADNNFDHMAAYQGLNVDLVQLPTYNSGTWTDNEFILAWEDIDSTSNWQDRDFTDFVVMVESVMVPVPAAVLLGILGLGAAGLKLRKYA
jgi:hypothetical protein